MKCRHILIAAIVLAAAFDLSAADAGDGPIASTEPGWPQWRGPRRDAVSGETGLLERWPDGGPPVAWSVTNIGVGWSAPIVSRGMIFVTGDVGPDLVIFAFGTDGQLKWKTTNGAAWKGSYPGARASPVLASGRLFHMNAHGRVACIDAATGREKWAINVLERFDGTVPTWAMSESLLVDGSRLIVTPGGSKASMAALVVEDGSTIWTSEPLPESTASYCSPVLFKHSGRRLIANCTTHHAWCVDADTGRRLWSVPFHGRYSVTITTPVPDGGRIFFATPDGPDGQMYRLPAPHSELGPELLWRVGADALTGGALLHDGILFANGCKTTKSLHAIEWASGRVLAELPCFAARPASHATAALVWADSRIYSLFDDGTMALLRFAGDSFEVLGRFNFVEAKGRNAWANPVLLDGKLYLRHHDLLRCFDVRCK